MEFTDKSLYRLSNSMKKYKNQSLLNPLLVVRFRKLSDLGTAVIADGFMQTVDVELIDMPINSID